MPWYLCKMAAIPKQQTTFIYCSWKAFVFDSYFIEIFFLFRHGTKQVKKNSQPIMTQFRRVYASTGLKAFQAHHLRSYSFTFSSTCKYALFSIMVVRIPILWMPINMTSNWFNFHSLMAACFTISIQYFALCFSLYSVACNYFCLFRLDTDLHAVALRSSTSMVPGDHVVDECHDDVIKWKHFPRYWPFVRGIPRWIPRAKASDAELWYFLWSAPEKTTE